MVATKARAKQSRKAAASARKAALAKAEKRLEESAPTPASTPSPLSSSSGSTLPLPPMSTPGSSVPLVSTSTVTLVSSASKRKLELELPGSSSSSSSGDKPSLPLAIVDLSLLATLFSVFQCRTCGNNLTLSSTVRKGFAHNLKVCCDMCSSEQASTPTSTSLAGNRCYDINRRMVLGFLNVGLGFAGMRNFCELLGLEGLTEKSFNRHVHDIHEASKVAKSGFLEEAANNIKTSHGSSDEILDIAESYDGTWQKRGHTSKHGLGAVIEITTGLVVDYHVMASYCLQCASTGKKLKSQDEDDYERWFEDHKSSCTVNHQGSSGAMEVEIAKVLWGRSIVKGFRYTTLVSDGDAKTYNQLMEMKPYGDETLINKEECTNHVAKRLGTGLHNLVSSQKAKGITLGGRKAGSLTQAKIGILQAHYKRAVASKCGTVEDLRRKIMCTLNHASSSDENPQHHDCPPGKKSWCFFQRALSFGREPPSHKGKSSSYISETVAKAC